ncbi:metalloregulator ArsR/SmtB family transcription factor [Candidatus Fermentibacterales bacterium]|nr:metalloregulator ArsR/SmtB family transcription factor [Candidatus Fermentibacterales bacterium]
MFCVLSRGPLNVSEICRVLGLRQSNVSHHLRKLLDAGLVERRGRSGWVYYELDRSEPFAVELSELVSRWAERIPCLSSDMAALSLCHERRSARSREFFDRSAVEQPDISGLLPDPAGYLDEMLAMLPVDGTVAELGCGAGRLLLELAHTSRRLIGVDQSEGMLSRARQLVALEDLAGRADLRLGRVEHLPMADGSVDAVVAHMVLHHVPEPIRALREAWRVLGPAGRLVVAELTAHGNVAYRETQGDLWPGFEPAQLEGWLGSSGFVDINSIAVASGAVLLVSSRKGGKEDRLVRDGDRKAGSGA